MGGLETAAELDVIGEHPFMAAQQFKRFVGHAALISMLARGLAEPVSSRATQAMWDRKLEEFYEQHAGAYP